MMERIDLLTAGPGDELRVTVTVRGKDTQYKMSRSCAALAIAQLADALSKAAPTPAANDQMMLHLG